MTEVYKILPYATLAQTDAPSAGRTDNAVSSKDLSRPGEAEKKTLSAEENKRKVCMEAIKLGGVKNFQIGIKDPYQNGDNTLLILEALAPFKEYDQLSEKICDTLLGNKPESFMPIPEDLVNLGLTENILDKILPADAKFTYIISSARIRKADILLAKKDAGATDQAISLLGKVISDPKNPEYCRADAAVKLGKALMSDKNNILLVESILNKVTGMAGNAVTAGMIPDKLKSLGITAEALNGISAVKKTKDYEYLLLDTDLLKARILTEKEGREIALEQEDIAQAKAIYSNIISKDHQYMSLKQNAAIGLGNILLSETATTTQALEVFASLLNGTALKIGGKTVPMTAVNTENAYNYDSVQLGYNKARLAMPADNKVQVKIGAENEFRRILASGSDKFLSESAAIELASLLKNSKSARDEAAHLFTNLQTSETPFISKRAVIELSIMALESKDARKEDKAAAETNLRAALNDPSVKGFLKNQICLALANRLAENKGTQAEAVSLYDNVAGTGSGGYMEASALINRANLRSGGDSTAKAQARQDYLDALNIISAESNNSDLRSLEIQADKGLTNVVSALEPGLAAKLNDTELTLDDGTVVKSRKTIQKEYQDAKAAGQVDPDSYMEADILLGGLEQQAIAYDHNKSGDAAASGAILSGFRSIIDGDYDPMIKNRARNGLSMALLKFGYPEEAKKVAAPAITAADNEITPEDRKAAMLNIGFTSIGDSDFNLAAAYFKSAQELGTKDDPLANVHYARALFLTDKLPLGDLFDPSKSFMGEYDLALKNIWKKAGINGGMPDMDTTVDSALQESGTVFDTLKTTSYGRFFILTALEAKAKQHYARGEGTASIECLTKAKELFTAWRDSGPALPADYLFEYQLHYDLASALLSVDRPYDAYLEYKQISQMQGVPNWYVKDQLRLLDPEQLTLTAGDNGDFSAAYRRRFDRGELLLNISEEGGRVYSKIYLDEKKTAAVKVELGYFRKGNMDASVDLEKKLLDGRATISAGAAIAKGDKEDITTVRGRIEANVNKNIRVFAGANANFHSRDIKSSDYMRSSNADILGDLLGIQKIERVGDKYMTYEVEAGGTFSKRIGKDLTATLTMKGSFGTELVTTEGSKSVNISVPLSGANVESGWMWDGNECSFTTKGNTTERYRQRYWMAINGYDDQGQPTVAWSVTSIIEPEQKDKTITYVNPLSPLDPKTFEATLVDIYTKGYAYFENGSPVHLDSEHNAWNLAPGEKPDPDNFDPDLATSDPSRPKVKIHEEKASQDLAAGSLNTVAIKVQGRDREKVPEGQWVANDTRWEDWKDLYTIFISTVPTPAGASVQVITLVDGKTGAVTPIYAGLTLPLQTVKKIVSEKVMEYAKLNIFGDITKKFHGNKLVPDGTSVSLSGSLSVKKGPKSGETAYGGGPNLTMAIPAGPRGYLTLSGGYNYYGGSGKNFSYGSGSLYGNVGYTMNLSGETPYDASTTLSVEGGTDGLYAGINKGPVSAGVGTGGAQLGFTANLKLGDTQVIGDLPVGISTSGITLGGVPVAAVNPTALGIASVIRAYDSTKSLDNIREGKAKLEAELKEAANDPTRSAYVRLLLDNAQIDEGRYTANWGKDSTRIPILNIITMLGGNRVRKNAASIETETDELINLMAKFKNEGVLADMEKGTVSPEYAGDVAAYINGYADYLDLSGKTREGSIHKAADIEKNIVKGIFAPVRLVGKAVGLSKVKTVPGKVSADSFRDVSSKKSVRKEIVAELKASGYIDQDGNVTGEFKALGQPGTMQLSSFEEKKGAIYRVLKDTAETPAAGAELKAPVIEATAENLKKQLYEDTMYLIYRLMATKGSTPETRAKIGELLSTLPDEIKTAARAFIDIIPVDIQLRSSKTVKVEVDDKKVKMTPETYAKGALDNLSVSSQLAIEKQAVSEYKGGRGDAAALFDGLQKALSSTEMNDTDGDKITDEVYSAAIKLFMAAASDPQTALEIGDRLKGLDEAQRETLAKLQDKIADFILNRRPGSSKLLGGQKANIKVTENLINVTGNNKDFTWKFTVQEFVKRAIAGTLRSEVEEQAKAKDLEKKGIKTGTGITGVIETHAQIKEKAIKADVPDGEEAAEASVKETDRPKPARKMSAVEKKEEFERRLAKRQGRSF